MTDPIRVVIADDSVLLREGLSRLLEESGFEVVAQAGDAEDLIRKVGAHHPDVAVVDVRMPPTHTDEGLRAARKIRADHPGTGVLVLSQYVEEAYALDLLSESTESTGYLLKDRVADIDRFTDAVRRVAEGGSALDPEVVSLLLGRRRQEDPLEALTNVVKYAHASQATVSVSRSNGHAVVEVADDGIGGADPGRGSGLRGLADRVSALDGNMQLDSPAGAGTRLRAEIPV